MLLWLSGLLFALPTLHAQEIYEVMQESRSPLHAEYQKHTLSGDLYLTNSVLQNPALLQSTLGKRTLFNNETVQGDSSTWQHNLFVGSEASAGKEMGDYMAVEGNAFKEITLRALGYQQDSLSTLLGKARFSTGRDYNVGWSTQRNAQLYWPYIVADSTGGNPAYELYNLMGAYSMQLKKVNIGVMGEYKGEFAFKQNDPRLENVSSWLNLRAGAAYLWKGYQLAAYSGFSYHQQNVDVKHFRSGQFTMFFTEYGFGMFDFVFSPVFNYIKHQHHISEVETALTLVDHHTRPLRMHAYLAHNYQRMNSEADLYGLYKLNLYLAQTNTFKAQYALLWNSSNIGMALYLAGESGLRKGKEYIYQKYVSATVDGVEVINYKRIGSQNRYLLRESNAFAEAHLSAYMPHATVTLLAGARYDNRTERYKGLGYLIMNESLTPQGGAALQVNKGAWQCKARVTYGYHLPLRNLYRVNIPLQRNTEFHHAFTPYAYRAYRGSLGCVQVSALKSFPNMQIGVRSQLFWQKGSRLKGVTYSATKFHNDSPSPERFSINLTHGTHSSVWGEVGIFALF